MLSSLKSIILYIVESKRKLIYSGRTVSLLGDLILSRGAMSRDSTNVWSCESVHSNGRENLIGGGNR